MIATHGVEANPGASIRDLVQALEATHQLPNANPPATLGVPASSRAPGRESEHSASPTTNERLPGSY